MKSKLLNKEEFSLKLSKQIITGKELLIFSVKTIEDLDIFKKNSKIWSEFNLELLKQSFSESNNEYKNEYEKCVLIIAALGNFSLHEKSMDIKDKIKKRLNCLESIQNRLELIPNI